MRRASLYRGPRCWSDERKQTKPVSWMSYTHSVASVTGAWLAISVLGAFSRGRELGKFLRHGPVFVALLIWICFAVTYVGG